MSILFNAIANHSSPNTKDELIARIADELRRNGVQGNLFTLNLPFQVRANGISLMNCNEIQAAVMLASSGSLAFELRNGMNIRFADAVRSARDIWNGLVERNSRDHQLLIEALASQFGRCVVPINKDECAF